MASPSASRFASALLPHAESGEVVDMLLSRADLTGRVDLSAAPSDAVGRKHAKGKLGYALTIAGHAGTSPEVLSSHGRDTRVSVRRQLISNPSTPYDLLVQLANWAHDPERRDETCPTIITRLTAADAVTVLETHGLGSDFVRNSYRGYGVSYASFSYPFEELAQKVIATGDRSLLERAYKLPFTELRARLSQLVYTQTSPVMSLTELLGLEGSETDVCAVRRHLVESNVFCSRELAQLLAMPWDTPLTAQVFTDSFAFLADGVPEILLDCADESVQLLAVRSNVRGELLDSMAERASLPTLSALVEVAGPVLTRSQEKVILQRLVESRRPNSTADPAHKQLAIHSIGQLLLKARYRVSSKLMLAALRAGSPANTLAWLSNRFPANPPRAGELTELVADSGDAFWSAMPNHGRTYGMRRHAPAVLVDDPETRQRMMETHLTGSLSSIMVHPWANECSAALGKLLIEHLPMQPPAAAWVTKRFQKVFGTDESCWESALTMAPTWEDDIESLIEVCLTLNGCDYPEDEDLTPRIEQLSLV